MDVRCLMYVAADGNELLDNKVSSLYDKGSTSIVEAIAKHDRSIYGGDPRGAHLNQANGTIGLHYSNELFVLVGGRASIGAFLTNVDNHYSFEAWRGSKLGLVIARKKELFAKNKTLVAVCLSDWRHAQQDPARRLLRRRPGGAADRYFRTDADLHATRLDPHCLVPRRPQRIPRHAPEPHGKVMSRTVVFPYATAEAAGRRCNPRQPQRAFRNQNAGRGQVQRLTRPSAVAIPPGITQVAQRGGRLSGPRGVSELGGLAIPGNGFAQAAGFHRPGRPLGQGMVPARILAAQQPRHAPGLGRGGTHVLPLPGELPHGIIDHFGKQMTVSANGWLLHVFTPTGGEVLRPRKRHGSWGQLSGGMAQNGPVEGQQHQPRPMSVFFTVGGRFARLQEWFARTCGKACRSSTPSHSCSSNHWHSCRRGGSMVACVQRGAVRGPWWEVGKEQWS